MLMPGQTSLQRMEVFASFFKKKRLLTFAPADRAKAVLF
jgi:hypothetical protein